MLFPKLSYWERRCRVHSYLRRAAGGVGESPKERYLGGKISLCSRGLGLTLPREKKHGKIIPAARMMTSEIPRFRVLVAVEWIRQPSMYRTETLGSLLTFVRALLELTVVRGLLNEIQDGLGEGLISDGPSY